MMDKDWLYKLLTEAYHFLNYYCGCYNFIFGLNINIIDFKGSTCGFEDSYADYERHIFRPMKEDSSVVIKINPSLKNLPDGLFFLIGYLLNRKDRFVVETLSQKLFLFKERITAIKKYKDN